MFFPYDVLKRERAEDRAYVGSVLIITSTPLPIGDNDFNNLNNTVLAMLLQSCKHVKTKRHLIPLTTDRQTDRKSLFDPSTMCSEYNGNIKP